LKEIFQLNKPPFEESLIQRRLEVFRRLYSDPNIPSHPEVYENALRANNTKVLKDVENSIG